MLSHWLHSADGQCLRIHTTHFLLISIFRFGCEPSPRYCVSSHTVESIYMYSIFPVYSFSRKLPDHCWEYSDNLAQDTNKLCVSTRSSDACRVASVWGIKLYQVWYFMCSKTTAHCIYQLPGKHQPWTRFEPNVLTLQCLHPTKWTDKRNNRSAGIVDCSVLECTTNYCDEHVVRSVLGFRATLYVVYTQWNSLFIQISRHRVDSWPTYRWN